MRLEKGETRYDVFLEDLSMKGFKYLFTKDEALEVLKRNDVHMEKLELNLIEEYYFKNQTLRAVGLIVKKDAERVRQILSKAIRKLRHPTRLISYSQGLCDFM